MTTAIDIITDSLEMLGVYAPGDAISDADSERMLFLLNAFLDEQAAQQVYFYGCTDVNVSLVPNQTSYTIGQSEAANVNVTKPTSITYGPTVGWLTSSGRGYGYSAGDTGFVSGSLNSLAFATYLIAEVLPGGAVNTFNITYPGNNTSGYISFGATPTFTGGAQPGKGTGFLINVTASGGQIIDWSGVGFILAAPVGVVSAIEYKTMVASAPPPGLPQTLNYVNGSLLGTLNVTPPPTDTYTMTFQAWNNRIINIPSLYTKYDLAVGTLDTLRTNLAVYAKNYFQSAQIDPAIVVQASFTMGFQRFQSLNSRATLDRFTLPTAPQKPT